MPGRTSGDDVTWPQSRAGQMCVAALAGGLIRADLSCSIPQRSTHTDQLMQSRADAEATTTGGPTWVSSINRSTREHRAPTRDLLEADRKFQGGGRGVGARMTASALGTQTQACMQASAGAAQQRAAVCELSNAPRLWASGGVRAERALRICISLIICVASILSLGR